MNITSTQLVRPKFQPAPQKANDDSTFFINLDPLSGIKDAFRTGAEETGQFIAGALPGVGMYKHFGDMVSFGGGNFDKSRAGLFLNTAGTIGAAVALGQMAFGVNPSIATAVSAVALSGSGIMNASIH